MKFSDFVRRTTVSLLFLSIGGANAQVSKLTLNTTLQPGNYVARDEVLLQPGAKAVPDVSGSRLYIDKTLLIPVDYNSNASRGNLSRNLESSKPVGSTPSGHSVTPLGSLAYSVPLQVAPGMMDLVPKLSMEYNSISGNGSLGYGWGLSGIQSITRSGKTPYHDEALGTINLDNNDVFLFDGNRLIPTSGSNGANNTIYGTETETFSRITSYNVTGDGPSWFKVETKNGLTLEFGNNTDSKLIPVGHTTVLNWMINKIYDQYGNYITYHYKNENGEVLIQEIKYTGNTAAGIEPYNVIKFYWDKRKDVNSTFYDGGQVNFTGLLRSIEIYSEDLLCKKYDLKYFFSNVFSYLNEIKESASDKSSLNTLLFSYGQEQASSTTFPLISSIGTHDTYHPIDYNDDGKTDLVGINGFMDVNNKFKMENFRLYQNTGNSTFSPVFNDHDFPSPIEDNYGYSYPYNKYPINKGNNGNMLFELVDFNGDSKEDIVVTNSVFTTNAQGVQTEKISFYRYLSNGNDVDPLAVYSIDITSADAPAIIRYGDFNGDQKLDVLVFYEKDTYFSYFKLFLNFANTTPTSVDLDVANWHIIIDNAFIGEQNGDGKSELLNIKALSETYTLKYNNSTNQLVLALDNTAGSSFYHMGNSQYTNLVGDFNGDRKTDYIYSVPIGGGNFKWDLRLNTGSAFTTIDITTLMGGAKPTDTPTKFYYARDLNGDGKTDFIQVYETTVNVYYSTGTTFIKETYTVPITLTGMGLKFGDFNGDGIEDIVLNSTPRILYLNKGGKSNFLYQAIDGFNNKTQFEFEPLSTNTAYSRTTTKNYPLHNYKGAFYVVSKITSPDGIGGNSLTTYSYEDAILHKQGKGLIGFMKMTSVNDITLAKKVDTYTYNATFFNLQLLKSSSYINNQLANEVTLTPAVLSLSSGKRYYASVTKSINTNSIAGYSITTDYTYNGDGNLTYQKITTGSLEVAETTNTYVQEGSWMPAKLSFQTSTIARTGETAYTRQASYIYNSKGLPTSFIKDPGKTKSVTESYVYDPNTGVRTQKTLSSTGLPSVTEMYEYNTNKRFVIKTTNSLNQFSTATYDPRWGKPLSIKGVDGLETKYEYDTYGRNTKVISPDNLASVTTYSWSLVYQNVYPLVGPYTIYKIKNETSGKPPHTAFYDSFCRIRSTESVGFNNEKILTVTDYHAQGYLYRKSETYIHNVTTTSPEVTYYYYDHFSRPVKTERKAGAANYITNYNYSYNQGNTTITTTTPDNKTFSKTTDVTGLLYSATDHGGTLLYNYYSSRSPRAVSLNGSVVSEMEYDEYGRQKKLYDSNAGNTYYDYNAYGQLTSQTDSKNQTFQFQYDILGRVTQKSGPDGNYLYQYVTSGNGLNQLLKEEAPNNISSTYTYDQYNRIIKFEDDINSTKLATLYEYDSFGNIKKQTYPSGFAVDNIYNSMGYLTQVKRSDNGANIWQALTVNSLGQHTSYTLGNNITTNKTYNEFGMPLTFKAGTIQDLQFNFNPANGNINYRQDNIKNLKETFTYDDLQRLTKAEITGLTPMAITYAGNGNITNKSDVGAYTYSVAKPNAVEYVTNPNGVISSNQQDITYTSFNSAQTLTEGGNVLTITYGPDQQRRKGVLAVNGTVTSTKLYHRNYEKEVAGATTREVHYIYGGDGLCAIYVNTNGTGTLNFTYTDHLGSILTVTDNLGAVIAQQSFDTWGRSRNPNDWSYVSIPKVPAWLYRGFTGHEHLRQFALINMNGRMYDPVLGRMLGVDNFVQEPGFTQSHNRYSYCFNNPLKFTDPDGENPVVLGIAIFAAFIYLQGVEANDWEWRPWKWGSTNNAGQPIYYQVGVGGNSSGVNSMSAGISAGGPGPMVTANFATQHAASASSNINWSNVNAARNTNPTYHQFSVGSSQANGNNNLIASTNPYSGLGVPQQNIYQLNDKALFNFEYLNMVNGGVGRSNVPVVFEDQRFLLQEPYQEATLGTQYYSGMQSVFHHTHATFEPEGAAIFEARGDHSNFSIDKHYFRYYPVSYYGNNLVVYGSVPRWYTINGVTTNLIWPR